MHGSDKYVIMEIRTDLHQDSFLFKVRHRSRIASSATLSSQMQVQFVPEQSGQQLQTSQPETDKLYYHLLIQPDSRQFSLCSSSFTPQSSLNI